MIPIVEQLRAARVRADAVLSVSRDNPHLLAYDANEIQRFVTASSRPAAMRGASAIVLGFDDETRRTPDCVFAGGGRALLVVDGADQAAQTAGRLAERYGRDTHGHVLTTAWVPLGVSEHAALTWLNQRLALEKDQAAPSQLHVGAGPLCDDCSAATGTRPSTRRGVDTLVCDRCAASAESGRRRDKESPETLQDVSKATNRLVALSADGNDLGALFSQVHTLRGLALASQAISAVFAGALDDASSPNQDSIVQLVAGGDDIKAFLCPTVLLPFLGRLTRGIEEGLAGLGDLEGVPMDRLRNVGIGIGIALSHDHHPASHLMDAAHRLESASKAGCRANNWRSAAAFANLMAGDVASSAGGDLVFDLSSAAFDALEVRVSALGAIPGSQREQLADAVTRFEREEVLNFFRYQVARSVPWRSYFDAIGLDWTDPATAERALPAPIVFQLVGMAREATR